MRTRREIETRLSQENDAFAIEVLRWVLAGGCPMCDHKKRKELEVQVQNGDVDPIYLETRYNWSEGTVMHHMDNHVEFDPDEATHVEKARSKSIDTLDSAEDIVLRIRLFTSMSWRSRKKHKAESHLSSWLTLPVSSDKQTPL